MDTAGIPNNCIQEASFEVVNGLELYGVEQFLVEVVSRKPSRWHDADMAPINTSCHTPEYWGTRQLCKTSPYFLQLIPGGEAHSPSENPLDGLAYPVDHVVACGPGNAKRLTHNPVGRGACQPVHKYQKLLFSPPSMVGVGWMLIRLSRVGLDNRKSFLRSPPSKYKDSRGT